MTEPNVDMLAEAREAQWSALTFLGDDAIKVVAPAKVNLFLGVGERRPDGFHEVVTAMHALSLHETLYMTCREPSDSDGHQAWAGPDGCIGVTIEVVDKTSVLGAPGDACLPDIPVEDNLAFRAIDALSREIGWKHPSSVRIRIEKSIPMQAGLGGGSADAAATLVGMAHFWGIAKSDKTLRKVAWGLGSDVAFFLEGGCGVFIGAGESMERRLDPMKRPVVLVKPDGGVSTREAYAAFDENPARVPRELLTQVEDATRASEVPLFNNLSPAAVSLFPEIAVVAEWLACQSGVAVGAAGEPAVLMSGSGAAVFAIMDSYDDALRASAAANARGWWGRATSFSSLRAVKL